LATSAPEEAVRWYSAALHALPPPRDDAHHIRALVDLGVAQRQAGQPVYRDTLLTAARMAQRGGANELLIQAALASCRGSFSSLGQVDAEKVAVLESALEVATPDSTAQARLLTTMAGELTWHPDHSRRIAVAEEAVRVARRSGDPGAVLFAILRPGAARWVPETSAERVRLCREAVELAEQRNDDISRWEALHLLAPTLLEAASTDQLDDDLAAASEVAAEVREPFMHLMSLLVRGCLAIAHGDLERAEKDLEEVLRIGRETGQPDAQAMYEEPLYVIRWHQGRLGEVLAGLRTVAALLPDVPTRWAALACAEATSGDAERARTMLRDAAQKDFAMFYGPPWLGCMCQWADVAADLAEADAGAVLYEKLLPWKHLFATGGPLPIHAVSLALGRLAALLGDVEAADGHFAEATLVHAAVRSPFGTAETALHWGRLLLDRKPERAGALLVTATEIADRHGYREIERQARDALRTA
jgi:tetratricopeptide (TPR) repeat protein